MWVAASGMTLGTPKKSGATRKYVCSQWLWSCSAWRTIFRSCSVCSESVMPMASSVALRLAVPWPQAQMPQMRVVRNMASFHDRPRSMASKNRGDSVTSNRVSTSAPSSTLAQMLPCPSTRVT